jgi:hypothetical protein
MAFPTTSVLDNFNRATLGTNWTNDPFHGGATAFPIQGSVAVGGTGYSEEWWNVATYGPDCECYVTISTNPTSGTSGQGFWVTARAQQESSAASTGDGYQAFVSKLAGTDKVQLIRIDNTVGTVLTPDTLTQEFADGESLGLEIIGSTLTAYRKSGGTWTSIGNRSDATYGSAGHLSFGWSDSGAFPGRFDDFGGGTVTSAAVTTTSPAPSMLPRSLGPSISRPLFFKGIQQIPVVAVADVINLTDIATAEAFSPLNLQDRINLAGIASAESVPTLKLTDTANLSGIASSEVVPTLNLKDFITLVGIASAESVGTLNLTDTINLTGIASAENVPPVTTGATDTVNLTDITTAETFSSLLLQDNISLGGIGSAEAFSALNLQDRISLGGILTAENVPAIFQSSMRLVGIASGEAVPGVTLTVPGAPESDGQRARRGYGT